jgi:hypothetical protein
LYVLGMAEGATLEVFAIIQTKNRHVRQKNIPQASSQNRERTWSQIVNVRTFIQVDF